MLTHDDYRDTTKRCWKRGCDCTPWRQSGYSRRTNYLNEWLRKFLAHRSTLHSGLQRMPPLDWQCAPGNARCERYTVEMSANPQTRLLVSAAFPRLRVGCATYGLDHLLARYRNVLRDNVSRMVKRSLALWRPRNHDDQPGAYRSAMRTLVLLAKARGL